MNRGANASRNRFNISDLGFSPAESRNLRIRSQMMTALRKFIEKEGLTQADAAKKLKVSQPRVSDLTRGEWLSPRGSTVEPPGAQD